MTLFLEAKTPIIDLFIDYIEVVLVTGEQVSLNWDYSGIDRVNEGFSAKYSGVCFDEEYENGRIAELEIITIVEIGYYTEIQGSSVKLEIKGMYFVDNEKYCYPKYNNDFDLYCTG